MYLKKLTFLLAAIALLVPNLANANEIDVRSGSVRIIKNSSGQIYVHTDRTSISLPERHYSRRTRRPRRSYYRRESLSCDRDSQYSTQISSSNGNTVEQTSIINNCR